MIFFRISEQQANTVEVVHTTHEEFALAHRCRRAMLWFAIHWMGWAMEDLPVVRIVAEVEPPVEEMEFEHESLPPTPPDTPDRVE